MSCSLLFPRSMPCSSVFTDTAVQPSKKRRCRFSAPRRARRQNKATCIAPKDSSIASVGNPPAPLQRKRGQRITRPRGR